MSVRIKKNKGTILNKIMPDGWRRSMEIDAITKEVRDQYNKEHDFTKEKKRIAEIRRIEEQVKSRHLTL